MHFRSKKVDGYRVFAVSGINTVSFAIDFREADTAGLLGFAVERHDPKENERYFMYDMKVFESVIPNPDERTTVTTFDAKVNESTDSDGKFNESFPREDNKRTVKKAKLPASAIALWRESNKNDIQHNKFLVLLRGAAKKPAAVWTGSTNLSVGGIHGQTNVGHWVRDAGTAAAFRKYWELLKGDPGAVDGDSKKDADAKRKAYREAVMKLGKVPEKWQNVPKGVSTVFSPRSGSAVLDMYVAMLDEASNVACITLAFGINKRFKARLIDNTPKSQITFFLLEKRDVANPSASTPFVALNAKNNVYQAWGAFLRDPLYQWARETNAKALGLNTHVSYVHSKFLLMDPLGADPIVVTGSANFSDASTNSNDENMLLIRGVERVADIYYTEFNRLFYHYYFRSVQEALFGKKPAAANAAEKSKESLFLNENDKWLKKYEPGALRRKRVEMFTAMANPQAL